MLLENRPAPKRSYKFIVKQTKAFIIVQSAGEIGFPMNVKKKKNGLNPVEYGCLKCSRVKEMLYLFRKLAFSQKFCFIVAQTFQPFLVGIIN